MDSERKYPPNRFLLKRLILRIEKYRGSRATQSVAAASVPDVGPTKSSGGPSRWIRLYTLKNVEFV